MQPSYTWLPYSTLTANDRILIGHSHQAMDVHSLV